MVMQILKGNKMKSVTISNLLKTTNSHCYVYHERGLLLQNSYFVTSKYATLEQLIGYLQEHIDYKTEIHYDYFIVYTNKTQEEIQALIDWLDGKEADFNCGCILVTCKL